MSPPSSSDPTSPRSRALAILAWVFPIALLAFSTFYFFGAIGRFNDDYFYLQRDLQTWQIRSLVLDRPFHVWRPLFQVVVPALHTLLWDHNWAFHLLGTLVHGLNCWLLFRLFVRFGLSPRLSAASGLLFMVYPVHFEAVFWSCCFPTLLATTLLLACFHAQLSWLEMPAGRPRGVRGLYPLGLGAIAFSIAALNEQPAGPLAVLPLLALLRPPVAGSSMMVHLRRSIVPSLFAGAALTLYLVGHFRALRARTGIIGKGPLRERLVENTSVIARDIPGELMLRDFATGAWTHGWAVLEQHAVLSVAFLSLLLLGAFFGARLWMSRDWPPVATPAQPPVSPRPFQPFALLAFGAAWTVFAWLPIVVSHSVTMPRLHYVPNIGLLIMAAAALQALAAAASRTGTPVKLLRLAGGIALAAAIIPFSVMMVGIQDGYRLRSERDRTEAEQLAALFPDVPPGTLFVPMRIESRVLNTGSWRFDLYFMSCWNWHYAAGWNLQQAFRRTDVFTVQAGFQEWMGVWAPTDGTDVRTTAVLVGTVARPLPTPNFARNPEGAGRLVPWDRLVPFTVDAGGLVRLYTRVLYTPTDAAQAFDFVPPLVERARTSRRFPDRNMTLRPFPDDLRRQPRDKARNDDENRAANEHMPPLRRRQQPKGAPQPE